MSELPVLDPVEQRILGALLEKQVTVPASYPMTLNALRTACNQTSSREPVSDYDERTVMLAAKELKQRELVRIVWADSGRRTLKYHQVLSDALELADDERAVLTVLLLRGEQAPGALKTRTDRLHPFADRDQVEACLRRLAARPDPLVRELARRPGERDNRWVHLLGPVESALSEDDDPPVAADREQVLADGGDARDAAVRAAYTAVVSGYAEQLSDELDRMPFERWLLSRVVELAAGRPVVDAGCGPGHVTDFLAAAGAEVTGIDLTPAMVDEARRRFPGRTYEVGDLRTLMRPGTEAGWGAVLGWYSLIHLGPSELPAAVAALARPLVPGGWLVLAMHAGSGIRRVDAARFGVEVDLDIVQYRVEEVGAAVAAAGLADIEWYQRGPALARGETTERLYLLARRPG